MKRTIVFLIIIVFLGSLLSAALAEDTKNEILARYGKGKFLRLKVDGIPTMIEKLPGNLGSKTRTWIIIKFNGEWKVRSFMGDQSDSTNILSEGDWLEVRNVTFSKKSVNIITRTHRAMHYEAKGRKSWLGSSKSSGTGKHGNIFDFRHVKLKDQQEIFPLIENFFDVSDTPSIEEAPVEIKVGMTIAEVEKLLGTPKKKAVIGNKTIYRYDDWKITFVDGVVTDIDI